MKGIDPFCGMGRWFRKSKPRTDAPAGPQPGIPLEPRQSSQADRGRTPPALPEFHQPTRPGTHEPVQNGVGGWQKGRFGVLSFLDKDGQIIAHAHPTYTSEQNPRTTPREELGNTILPVDRATGQSLFAITESHTMPLVPGTPIYGHYDGTAASTWVRSAGKGGTNYLPSEQPMRTLPMTHSQAQSTEIFEKELNKKDPTGELRLKQEFGMVMTREKDGDGKWKVTPAGPMVEGTGSGAPGQGGWSVKLPLEQLQHPNAFASMHSHPDAPHALAPSVPDQMNARNKTVDGDGPYDIIRGPDGKYRSYDGRLRIDASGQPHLGHTTLIRPGEDEDTSGRNTPPPSPGVI